MTLSVSYLLNKWHFTAHATCAAQLSHAPWIFSHPSRPKGNISLSFVCSGISLSTSRCAVTSTFQSECLVLSQNSFALSSLSCSLFPLILNSLDILHDSMIMLYLFSSSKLQGGTEHHRKIQSLKTGAASEASRSCPLKKTAPLIFTSFCAAKHCNSCLPLNGAGQARSRSLKRVKGYLDTSKRVLEELWIVSFKLLVINDANLLCTAKSMHAILADSMCWGVVGGNETRSTRNPGFWISLLPLHVVRLWVDNSSSWASVSSPEKWAYNCPGGCYRDRCVNDDNLPRKVTHVEGVW